MPFFDFVIHRFDQILSIDTFFRISCAVLKISVSVGHQIVKQLLSSKRDSATQRLQPISTGRGEAKATHLPPSSDRSKRSTVTSAWETPPLFK
jgi:hypothetical protein